MTGSAVEALRDLLHGQRVAALGTLHRGEPFVSMVPFALLPDGGGIVVHVSRLAAHTGDMLAGPRVSVLIAAPETPGTLPQALPRVTIQGDAAQLAAGDAAHRAARDAYLARFPHAERIFALPDFSLFAIRPVTLRLVAGFAQAVTLGPDALAAAAGAAAE